MKTFRIFLFVLIVIGIILLCTQKFWVPKLVNQILLYEDASKVKEVVSKQTGKIATEISITNQRINEENFTGSLSVIYGESTLAINIRKCVESTDQINNFLQS